MNIVDVGANYGVYTLTMAKACGPSGKVWSFEPAKATAAYLEASVRANGFTNVTVVKAGLSNTRRRAVLSTQANSELNHVGAETDAGEAIDLTTLDDVADMFADRTIDFVKLDAEGEEPNIIDGAARFLERHAPVVMFEIKNGHATDTSIAARFARLGFGIYRLAPGLNALVPLEDGTQADGYLLNLFAVKPSRVAALAARGLLAHGDPAPHAGTTGWRAALSAQPWARTLMPLWLGDSKGTGRDGWADHKMALDGFFASQDPDVPVAARRIHVTRAFAAARRAVDARPSLPRLLSLARIALAFGLRVTGAQTLGQVLDMLRAGGSFVLDEPFLAPGKGHETIAAAGRIKEWLIAATMERYEAAAAYSSYVNPRRSLSLLERLGRNPCLSIAGARRLAMSRAQCGGPSSSKPGTARRHPARIDTILPDLETPIAIADIGARASSEGEIYRSLIARDIARVIGFEPDQSSVAESARRNRWSVYYPDFIGDGKPGSFHLTNRPMTASLFKPDRSIVDRFNNLGDLLQVVDTHLVATKRLDDAVPDDVDMIKIDIQGGEHMAFDGGGRILSGTMLIQTEVEFVPLYENQPLFAEIDQCLRRAGFLFHSFLSMAGRAFKPLMANKDPNAPIRQMLWADAVYVKDFRSLAAFPDQKLAKLAILLDDLYGSYDLAWQVLRVLDERNGSRICNAYAALLNARRR